MVAGLAELLERNVAQAGESVALTHDATHVSWAELDVRARRVAGTLVDLGVPAQERVLYLGRNSPAYFDTLFGAALAGIIFVPLNWRLSVTELAAIVTDTGATVVVVESAFHDAITEIVALVPHACTVINVNPTSGRPVGPLLSAPGDGACRPGTVRATTAESIAFQLYTSGTTGRPKGAMFANGTNVRALLDLVSERWGLTERDTALAALPLFHMGGLAWALASMARRARLVLIDFEPTAVLDTCEAEEVTMTFFVPAMLAPLIEAARARSRALHVRRLMYSGAPVAPHLLRAAMKEFGCEFVQVYGMTEATGSFAQLDPGDHDPGGPREHLLRSAGRVYPWTELRIAEPVAGRALPAGETGEVWTRSVQNMAGYFDRPEEMAETLTLDGWLRTGDIGYVDDEGYLFLLDRRKDVIISGGENVYPVEVENVLAGHPGVSAVAVVGAPDERWGETVVAVIVPTDDGAVDADEVIAYARDRLATYKCPRRVEFRSDVQRTATGKIRKDLIREPFWAGHDRRIN